MSVLQPQLGVHDVTEVPVDWTVAHLEERLQGPRVHAPTAPGRLRARRGLVPRQEYHGCRHEHNDPDQEGLLVDQLK